MKQVVQLYIEGQQVELFGDESISLNQSIKNAKDISKVFTEFSQSFTVPASRTNNKIFKHYYNFDIIGGFDARKKASANIELNSLPFRDGKIRLEGVELKNNKPEAYKITFFGNTVELKDLLGEDKLSSLNWLSNFKRSYSASSIATDCNAGGRDFTVDSVLYADALTVPLISVDGQEVISAPNATFNYLDLKYGIRLYVILKAIEEAYGIEWASDSFFKDTTNDQFYNLYMWMHKSKGRIDVSGDVTELYDQLPVDTSSMTRVICTPSFVYVSGLTGGNLLNYDLDVTTATINDYKITIKKDGVIVNEKYVSGGGNTTLTGNLSNTSTGYEVFITGTSSDSFTCAWDLADPNLSESHTYTGSSQSLGTTYVFNPINELPDMKVIDFLSGMFKMFNLVAYVQNDGKIQVKDLDSYYAGGTTRDITSYVDVSQSSVNVALPFREINFEYEGRGTSLAKEYEELYNIGWGNLEYNGGEILDGDVYKVQIPFEHMQYIRVTGSSIQYGRFVDDNGDAYFGMPLLYYPILKTGNFVIISGHGAISYYTIPSNSVNTSASTDDDTCHFGLEINEFTPADSFEGSLYKNYYESYIADVFNNKRRLTQLRAILPVGFLINYNLADTLIIGQHQYRINSINTNLNTGESKLELLNIV